MILSIPMIFNGAPELLGLYTKYLLLLSLFSFAIILIFVFYSAITWYYNVLFMDFLFFLLKIVKFGVLCGKSV